MNLSEWLYIVENYLYCEELDAASKSSGEINALDFVEKLANFYKKNKKMPQFRRNVIADDEKEEKKLFIKLINWKRAVLGKSRHTIYPSVFKKAKELGLPDNWLQTEIRSEENLKTKYENILRDIAKFYISNKRLPSSRTKKFVQDPKETILGKQLALLKRLITKFPNLISPATIKELGLPENILIDKKLDKYEREAAELVKKTAEFYRKNNRLPQNKIGKKYRKTPRELTPEEQYETDLAVKINYWRQTAKMQARGNIYMSAIELAEKLGLPDNWLDSITRDTGTGQSIMDSPNYKYFPKQPSLTFSDYN